MATTAPVLESFRFRPERRRATRKWREPERRVSAARRARERRRELEALFLSSLPTIESAIGHVVRRHRLTAFERDDFASEVHLAVIQHDYRILDRFQGHSSLRTYLIVVVQRLFIDHRRRAWGKWRPSALARELGPVALQLESLIHRDGRTVAEAVETLRYGGVTSSTRDELASLAARLPARSPRRPRGDAALVDIAASELASPETALDGETTAARTQAVVTEVLASLAAEDRLILRFRFEDGLSTASVARSMQLDQKNLYRRIDRVLARFRRALHRHGIEWADLRAVIARGQCDLRLRE